MKRIILSTLCTLLAPLALSSNFPVYTSKNLAGQEKKVPTELRGSYKLLLVAFLRKQQADVDTWTKPVEELAKTFNTEAKEFISSYEIPVLPKMDAARRLFIQNGMKLGVPTITQREHVFSLYIDKEAFKQALDIKDENIIHVYLIGNKDAILWKTTGIYTPEKGKELLTFLNKVAKTKN